MRKMYRVGHKTLPLEDASRQNWLSTGNRPLLTEVWYPATDDAEETECVFGGPKPLFRAGAMAEDAALSERPSNFPLVVLSHGTGGSALQMSWLGRRLAARGYLAAAVNHHGNNSVEPYLAQGFLLWWERASDLSVLINHLLADETGFGPRVDETRIGVAGFSLGGYTAIELIGGRCCLNRFDEFCASSARDTICDGPREFPGLSEEQARLAAEDPLFQESVGRHNQSYKDERVRAAFLMSPALGMAFTAAGLADIVVPVHIVMPEGDTEVPPKTNGYRFAELIAGSNVTVLEGPVNHYVFLCEATEHGKRLEPACCIDHSSVDRQHMHRRVADLATGFFDEHLNRSAKRFSSKGHP